MNAPPVNQACCIAKNEYFICITTELVFRASTLDPLSYNVIIGLDSSANEIGKCVKSALSKSRFLKVEEVMEVWNNGDQNAEIWISEMSSFLNGVGKRRILKNMVRVFLRQQDNVISLSPTRHNRIDGWVGHPVHEQVNTSQAITDEELGDLVNKVLELCD